jgi:choline dehydrogenase-like flavoprotein
MTTQGTTYDAIVVGSGITGGWAAKELAERGLNTLVLEAGRDINPSTDACPLLRVKRDPRSALWCPLVTQSGHPDLLDFARCCGTITTLVEAMRLKEVRFGSP